MKFEREKHYLRLDGKLLLDGKTGEPVDFRGKPDEMFRVAQSLSLGRIKDVTPNDAR